MLESVLAVSVTGVGVIGGRGCFLAVVPTNGRFLPLAKDAGVVGSSVRSVPFFLMLLLADGGFFASVADAGVLGGRLLAPVTTGGRFWVCRALADTSSNGILFIRESRCYRE